MRIAVVNLKGGTGKTITAVHLAAGLADHGRTLLVDADPQGSALSWSEAAEGFPCQVIGLPVRDLHRRVPGIAEGYEHVVIDTPPGDGDRGIARSAVLAAEVVVVPMPPSTMDVNRLQPTLELIAEAEAAHPIALHILITRTRAGTRLARAVRELLVELEVPALETEVPLREAYAASFGAPPAPYVDYAAVLEEIRR